MIKPADKVLQFGMAFLGMKFGVFRHQLTELMAMVRRGCELGVGNDEWRFQHKRIHVHAPR